MGGMSFPIIPQKKAEGPGGGLLSHKPHHHRRALKSFPLLLLTSVLGGKGPREEGKVLPLPGVCLTPQQASPVSVSWSRLLTLNGHAKVTMSFG